MGAERLSADSEASAADLLQLAIGQVPRPVCGEVSAPVTSQVCVP